MRSGDWLELIHATLTKAFWPLVEDQKSKNVLQYL